MRHDSATHHVLPVRLYLTIGAILLVMTGITVAVAQFDFGEANLIVAMFIAAIKASLVVLFFMHLKYDNKIYSMIFIGSLIFLALFITLTMLDTMRRDDIYDQVAHPINKQAVMPARPSGHGAAEGHEGAAAPSADTSRTGAAKLVEPGRTAADSAATAHPGTSPH